MAVATGCAASSPTKPIVSTRTAEPRAAPLGACVPGQPERCANALDDDCNGLIDEGCGSVASNLLFMAAWREPAVDVDLRVFEPGGALIEPGVETQSGLTLERDCPGLENECRGLNIERVYLKPNSKPKPGRYGVVVRLERLSGAQPPISVNIGARVGGHTHGRVVSLTREGQEIALSWTL